MIDITHPQDDFRPAVVCDACCSEINDAFDAVALRGPGGRAVFAHKGTCHRIAAAKLSTAGDRCIELAEVLELLPAAVQTPADGSPAN